MLFLALCCVFTKYSQMYLPWRTKFADNSRRFDILHFNTLVSWDTALFHWESRRFSRLKPTGTQQRDWSKNKTICFSRKTWDASVIKISRQLVSRCYHMLQFHIKNVKVMTDPWVVSFSLPHRGVQVYVSSCSGSNCAWDIIDLSSLPRDHRSTNTSVR